MEKITRFFIIRHAVTDLTIDEQYQGKTDMPLNKVGVLQAKRLKKYLRSFTIDLIVTSPSKRAKETSKILSKDKSIPIKIYSGFSEINFGVWEGFIHKEIELRYPKELSNWNKNPFINRIPGGENMDEVMNRVATAYKDIIKEHQGKTIEIVGHGGSLNALLCHLFHILPSPIWQFRLSPASLTEILINHNNQAVMTLFNNTSYLEGI